MSLHDYADLPPTDHLARVLLKRGAREHAVTLLRAAVRRDPGERACAALLRAVEARPDASVYGPDLDIDMVIVEAYARRGWLVEALSVLYGAGLAGTPEGMRRADVLEELLAPSPDEADPELRALDQQIHGGGAALALTALDQRVARGAPMPGWARRRHELLSTLMMESAPAALAPREIRGKTPVGAAVEPSLSASNLVGALEAARRHSAENPSDHDAKAVVVALGRLVEAMAEVSVDLDANTLRTQPMTGHHIGLFQLRMCNLDVAERIFRKLLLEAPNDQVVRGHLDDVLIVQQALGAEIAPAMEPPVSFARPKESQPGRPAPATRPERVAPVVSERPVRSSPMDIEPTRRVDSATLSDDVARSKERAPARETRSRPQARFGRTDPRLLERALEEDTRETSRKKPITTPELLKKSSSGRITGEGSWSGGGGASPPQASDWEDVSTEIGDPDQMAELMLKQGFVDRAIQIYERLVVLNPKRDRYKKRLDEIKDMAQRGIVPAPLETGERVIMQRPLPGELLGPDPEMTAQVDMNQLPELASTMPAGELPDPPPRAIAILDRMAPSVDEGPVVLEDDLGLGEEDPFGVESPEWGDDDTTMVGSSEDEEDNARTEPPPSPREAPAPMALASPSPSPRASGRAQAPAPVAPGPFDHAQATVLDQRPPSVAARAHRASDGSVMVHRIILVR